MSNLSESLVLLATRVGEECKTLHDKLGTLADLTTTDKTNLVAALNELNAALGSAATIDDTQASATTTYSSSKIASEILAASTTLKNDLLCGAGEAYDTLKELAVLIQTNQSAIQALETIAGGVVRYDKSQSLTDGQKTQTRSNIGAAATADLNALTTSVGSTTTNFVTVFESALNA